MKYPIEIEFTDFCSLKCKYCINPLFLNKGFLSIANFDFILNYIYDNKEKILYINFSGIWDIFLHPKKNVFFKKIIKKFAQTNINILIPTKGNSLKKDDFEILQNMKSSWININISVWIFSIIPEINDFIMWKEVFSEIISFIKNCKKYKIPFSLELLNNKSEKEKQIFEKFLEKLNIWWTISSYHNFAGNLEINKEIWKNDCNFSGENYKINDFYCSFIPFISKNWNIYSCSISWKNKKFFVWNIQNMFKKFPNYLDLVKYIQEKFLNSEKCKKCSIYQDFYGKS